MKKLLFAVLLTAGMFFAACSNESAKFTVGIALSSSDEFNTNLRREYEAYVKTIPDIKLVFVHASSATGQVQDIENLISQKCNVIVIRAADAQTVVPVLNGAKEAGIKIIIDETRVDGVDYDVLISGSQETHGILLGQYLLDEMISKGVIDKARIGYIAGVISDVALGRKDGFTKSLNPSQLEFVIGGANGYELAEGWSATKAQQVVENWITNGSIETMNVIACMNDEIANGAIAALGTAYPKMIVLGVDGSAVGQANIRSGKMKATTFQDVRKSVKAILDICVLMNEGKQITYTDASRKVVDPKHISLMTLSTIDSLVGQAK